MAFEFIFSLQLNMFYIDILPSKHFFSAKENVLEIIGLGQKLAMQVLYMALDFQKPSNQWIFVLVNFSIDAFRNIYFYKRLPFFSFKTLSFHGIILMLITSINLACLVTTIRRSIDAESSSLAFLVVIWIILALLLIRSSQAGLKRMYWNILLDPNIENANLLIHRVSAMKELQETKGEAVGELSGLRTDYSWKYLAKNCINSKIQNLLKIDDSETALDINNEEDFDKLMSCYLKKLLKIYPQNKFLKLYTAHFYIKNLKLIRDPIDILSKIQNNSGFQTSLNAELLLIELQNALREKFLKLSEDKKNHLNLYKYLHEKNLYIQARDKIVSQASLQIKICNEMRKETPNLLQIFDDSQKLSIDRQKTSKHLRITVSKMSEYHIEPLLLYAKYHLILNHSIHDNIQFKKVYSMRLQKYQKYFDQDQLVEENMFHRDVSFTIFSDSKTSLGKVYYASKAMRTLMGHNDNSIIAMNIANNTPPCFYNSLVEYHKLLVNIGERGLGMGISRGFLYTLEGYLIEADVYVNIHPFVTGEFYLNHIRKDVKSDREYMYVLENGDIDSTTEGIGLKLGLTPSRKNTSSGTEFNLRNISEELFKLNGVFNQVFYATENQKKIPEHKVDRIQEIYSTYTTSGQEIALNPATVSKGEEPIIYYYNCKVTNVFLGGVFVKLYTFEEKYNKKDDQPSPPIHQYKESKFATAAKFPAEDDEEDYEKTLQSGSSDDVEEKKDGWIDFPAMISRRSYLDPTHSLRTTVIDTQRAPSSSRHLNETTSPELVTEVRPPRKTTLMMAIETSHNGRRDSSLFETNSPGLPVIRPRKSTFNINSPPTKESTGGVNPTKQIEVKQRFRELSIATSIKSRFSQQKRIFYLYGLSLKTKSSPKVYKFLVCLFFLVFIALFSAQLALKNTLDQNLEDLRVSKDILRSAQLRTLQQVTIGGCTRMLRDLNFKTLRAAAFGPLAFVVPTLSAKLLNTLLALGETNQNLLSSASSLSEEIRFKLFASDVVVWDTYFGEANQTHAMLNTFLAINRIVQTGLRMSKNIRTMPLPEAFWIMNFMLRNSVNELLLKNEDISQIILESLNTQRQTMETTILGSLLLLSLTFAVFLLIVIWTLWRQYIKQMRNLSAFCQVNPNKLNEIYLRFLKFKQSVEEDEHTPEYDDTISSYFRRSHKTTDEERNTVKHNYSKIPDCWSLQKSYYLLASRATVLIMGVIIMVIATSTINQKAIKSSQTMQEQIYFLDHSNARASVVSGSAFELTAMNNIAFIEKRPALEELEHLKLELATIRQEIYNTLLDSSMQGNENSGFIERILYKDACSVLNPVAYSKYCTVLIDSGYKQGLVYVLSSYSDMVDALVQQYNSSNKTAAALQDVKEQFVGPITLLLEMIKGEMSEMANLIDVKFEENLENTRSQRIDIIIGYTFLVICIGLLVWRTVLKVVRDSLNQFKNVLAVLPSDLVLGSFILRTFLIKTSQGTLDPVKNDL